jgi:membrane protease subunit HflK
MPTDQNPWNQGGPGSGRPPTPPRIPDIPPGWGGGGPQGPQPPDFSRLAEEVRGLLRGLFQGGGRLLALFGLVLFGAWLWTTWFLVQPDEVGLVMRFGAYNRTTPPGLNFHAPWPIESALLLPVTRINRIEIGFRSGEGDEVDPNPRSTAGATEAYRPGIERDLREESLMLTGDENIVDINASVFWRIRDAEAFAFNTRNPENTVKSAAESVLRQVIGHTDIQAALTGGRAAIEQAVITGAQKILDQYGAGVEITQVQLQKVDPPAEVVESFRDVQRANTDADRARNEAQSYANDIVPRARGEAAAITAAAQGEKTAAIAASQGQAKRFLSVYAAYTQAKDITLKRLYIETMEDLLAHSDTTVVDDKLKGLLSTLSLNRAPVQENAK